jgi:hypothetical protein
MAEFVAANLPQDTPIGLLDIVPFADIHLELSGADVRRVGLHTTLDDLRQQGLAYVIGTNLIGEWYGEPKNTIWLSKLVSDQGKIAEVGSVELSNPGWPVGDILLYLSRVPPAEASQ